MATTPPKHAHRFNWRYFRNLVLFTLLALFVAFYFVIPFFLAIQYMHPTRYPIGEISPADLNLSYTDVTLHTRDGLTLHGWYIPPTNGAAMILIHAFNGNRTGTIYHADLLAKHGYGILMYDTRAQGESDGELYAFGSDAVWDAIAALDYLKTRPEVDPERIGVLGLSAGAQISIRAAAESGEIAAVVAEGAGYPTFEDWKSTAKPVDILWRLHMWMIFESTELLSGIHNPLPLRQVVSQIAPTPLYLIAAGYDRLQNQAYFDAAGEPKTLWSREEPGHIDALFTHPEEYRQRVIGFLDQALLYK